MYSEIVLCHNPSSVVTLVIVFVDAVEKRRTWFSDISAVCWHLLACCLWPVG